MRFYFAEYEGILPSRKTTKPKYYSLNGRNRKKASKKAFKKLTLHYTGILNGAGRRSFACFSSNNF